MSLRDYQQHAVDMTLDLWAQGVRSVLFVCPTGGGKTHVFAELARLNKGRTLILADRKSLVDQAASRCAAFGLSVGFEQADRRTGARLPRVVCATIQSIARPERLRRFKPDTFSLIVVDEADLGIAPSYLSVLEHFAGARVFGCTATPDRADGRNLGEVFEDVAARVEMADLIRAKHLPPMRAYRVRIESVSLDDASKDGGDFTDASLERILAQERPLHEVARPALDIAGDRPAVVFGTSVRHAESLAEVLNRYRPGCARVIHGKTPDSERATIFAAFERREFQFLCNCSLVLRGVDLPFVSCVVMARPTLSRALYAQSIGRGMRIAEGKSNLLVLDFTDNSDTHRLVSPVDILVPLASEEVRERAREIMDEAQGTDPLEALDRAEMQLNADPVLRERVRAKVEFRLKAANASKSMDWDAQPLGREPDRAIAHRLGVSAATVRLARKARNIPPYGNGINIDWDAQPLGMETDTAIARRLGVEFNTVCANRQKRGIPPFQESGRREIAWDEQPLGQEPDRVIARRLGVSSRSVFSARKHRDIPLCQDGVVTKDIPWDEQPLGQEPDRVIARRLGVSQQSVAYARRKRNIPPCQDGIIQKGILWDGLPLGQMPDAEIARQQGVNQGTVAKARRRRGIPPFLPRDEPQHRVDSAPGTAHHNERRTDPCC